MKIAFTVCTTEYLAQAKTLADSLVQHNPTYHFIIGLLDKKHAHIDYSLFEPYQILEVETINFGELPVMAGRYNVFELSNAVKPVFALYFLQTFQDVQTIMYMDSDILVMDHFGVVESHLKTHDICLTPHITSPLPNDDVFPNERSFLNAGIYNGGFFALSNRQNSVNFLHWWKERLISYCKVDFANGEFVDQLWMNLIPLFFKDVAIITNPGYNVAYWNLHEREISCSTEGYRINDEYPLIFYHFSGYNIEYPENLSKYQGRYDIDNFNCLKTIINYYKEILLDNQQTYFSSQVGYYSSIKIKEQQEREEQIKQRELQIKLQIKVDRNQRLAERKRLKKLIPTLKRLFPILKRLAVRLSQLV